MHCGRDLSVSFQMVCRAALAGVVIASAACIHTTPFDADPTERDLTRKNLEALAKRTPPAKFKFITLGDTHDEYDDFSKTVDIINKRNDIEFVVLAGDMSDRGLRQELEWTQEILARLHVPYLTAIGNHDAISSGALTYRRMYGPLDYRFRYGGIEFVLFNSNSLEFPDDPVPNFAWIDAQLDAATDAKGVVLITHLPPAFPPAKPEGFYDPAQYEKLLTEHKVTLLVHSHLDDWGLWTEQGAVSLQCGTFQADRFYNVVTIEGSTVSIERCHFETCAAVVPGAKP